MNWLRKADEYEGGAYLHQNEINPEELRTEIYHDPYTKQFLGDNNPRGTEPQTFCPQCGMSGTAYSEENPYPYCTNCQIEINFSPKIIGPSQFSSGAVEIKTQDFPMNLSNSRDSLGPEHSEPGSFTQIFRDY